MKATLGPNNVSWTSNVFFGIQMDWVHLARFRQIWSTVEAWSIKVIDGDEFWMAQMWGSEAVKCSPPFGETVCIGCPKDRSKSIVLFLNLKHFLFSSLTPP